MIHKNIGLVRTFVLESRLGIFAEQQGQNQKVELLHVFFFY